MASISSLTGTSSTSSIYGNRNIISGLASGLDTETLIENAVKGYQTKIQGLQQKQTQVQWKQDAYRSIIDKMVNLNRKYTSYTSSTNLFSQSFFNNAVTTSVLGKNADAVSATGRATSDVQINGIKSLAASARYSVGVNGIEALANNVGHINDAGRMVTTGVEGIDLAGDVTVGKLSGGMNITYGGNSVYLSFTEKDVYKNAEEMAKGIEDKLGDALVKTGSGDYVKASDRIGVKVDGDRISFYDKSSAGNSTYISAADKSLQSQLGITPGKDAKGLTARASSLTENKNVAEYLSDKSLNVTFNGTSKTIDLKDFKTKADETYEEMVNNWKKDHEGEDLSADKQKEFQKAAAKESFESVVNEGLEKAFGKGKVDFEMTDDGKLSFSTGKGDTLSVTSAADKALGLGENGLSSYLNLNTKLKDLFSEPFGYKKAEDVDKSEIADSIDEIGKNGKKYVLDSEGYLTDKEGVRVPQTKKLTINGEEFEFGEDTTINSLINKINGNKDAGVNISYSNLTNKFAITATETGTSGSIEMKGELAKLFGFNKERQVKNEKGDDYIELAKSSLYTAGTDAVFNVTVNGEPMELTRSSNTVDFDGMSVTLNKTFGYEKEVDADGNEVKGDDGNPVWKLSADPDPIKFSTKTDSDKIVDAIQSFVNDYNEMVTEIRTQYATQPAEKSSTNHTRYMPLTDEDKEGMSDDAIAAYEEKAKQGILFGETELSNLHSALRNAITGNTLTGSYTDNAEFVRSLRDIGITTEYSNGLTTLSLDTDKLRSALENDPDSVRDAFAQTTDNGASTDGLMQRIQKVTNQYANTSSANPGILIQRAGSQYSPLSINNNALQDQYDRYTEQIEKVQDTISNRIDYYTKQFTALEQMMMQMNNQSSMLSGLMSGGSGGY